MSTILTNQNEADALQLLRASTVAYTKAKILENSVFVVLTILALAYPFVLVFNGSDTLKLYLYGWSFLVALLTVFFDDAIKGRTVRGAIFKEEFDTRVLGLPWKSTIPRADMAEVSALAAEYDGPPIRDWYSNSLSNKIPPLVAVAVCQRANSSWDIELRRRYMGFLRFCLGFYTVLLCSLFVIEKVDARTIFLIGFAILSEYTYVFSVLRGHHAVIAARRPVAEKLDDIILRKRDAGLHRLRDIQDEIFFTRKESAKVPNWFFKLHRVRLERAFEEYIKSVNRHFMEP
jgi:hypothetical protein